MLHYGGGAVWQMNPEDLLTKTKVKLHALIFLATWKPQNNQKKQQWLITTLYDLIW